MLTALSIRDIVLIDEVQLRFDGGLTVLTGETGAGKSILLDSLHLALGGRAEAALVRHGAARGQVVAEFSLAPDHPALALLSESDLTAEDGQLILRRSLNADGRSRAHINDQPVSIGLMRRVGELLVEIHGQHDERGLLDARGHRALLDQFGGHDALLAAVRQAHAADVKAQAALADAEAQLAAARADEDYLRHAAAELEALAPQPGEESQLADTRAELMRGEKLAGELEALEGLLSGEDGVEMALGGLMRRLDRLDPAVRDLADPLAAPLDRAQAELAEAAQILVRLRAERDYDPGALEAAEARLFELRALARKHKVAADDLPDLAERLRARLTALDRGEEAVEEARADAAAARARLADAVLTLRQARHKAADALAKAVHGELPDLKLGKARFAVAVEAEEPERWGSSGGDRVAFEIATNPGAPLGPLIKIASGGELARFILALKVALAGRQEAATLIFDEVDRGIGGATADAVGARLARLADHAQLLVVTHSPQVAARGRQHLHIAKSERKTGTRTGVTPLTGAARREEIARMLSGAEITDAARAAADSLLDGQAARATG